MSFRLLRDLGVEEEWYLNLQDKFTEAEYYITDGVHPHVAVATLIADE